MAALLGDPATGVATHAVGTALESLVRAAGAVTSGGITLPTVQIDQVRDLLTVLHEVSGRRPVLILDQWEKSTQLDHEAGGIDSFLRNPDRWPPCHILAAVRDEGNPLPAPVRGILRDHRGPAEEMALGGMDLGDAGERDRLTHLLRVEIPGAGDVADERLLALVGDHPGVLHQWRNQSPPDEPALARVAAEAHAGRFRDVERALDTLDDSLLALAIRLMLAPLDDHPLDSRFATVVLGGRPATGLERLKRAGVLDSLTPPSFGHPKRLETAIRWTDAERRLPLRAHLPGLAADLARPLRGTSPDGAPFAAALAALGPHCRNRGAPLAEALSMAAASLFGRPTALPVAGLAPAAIPPDTAALMSMGLFNTLVHAKDEGDTTRRDAQLDELRALAAAHPGEPIVATIAERLERIAPSGAG